MARFFIVVMLAAAAGCASSKSSGTCDPATATCACSDTDPCADGFKCDPGTSTCVADVDAGLDAPIDAALKGFGEPCLDKHECASDICIMVGTGGRCTTVCNGGDCPSDWGCFGVIGAIEPGHVDEVCVPVTDQLCSPCATDGECTQIGVDRCLTYPDDKQFCGRDCRTVDCPTGFACTDMVIAGMPTKQCVPTSGACDCQAANLGMTEGCTIMTPFQTACAGTRTCGGATGWGTCAPPSNTDLPDGSYQDDNCDGIDGDVGRGIFVAGGGSNTATCGLSSQTPCQTIRYGIVRAVTEGHNQVFVQAGVYNEVVVLLNGINVWGGYDFSWQRAGYATAGHVTTIAGAQDTGTGGDGEWLAVRAHDLIVPVTIGDVIIRGPSATGTVAGNGKSSYAVHVKSATVRLDRLRIEAGVGADGATGSPGTDAVIVDRQGYMDGGRGGDGQQYSTACDSSSRGGGGPRGTNTCSQSPSGRAMNGGAGGAGGQMDTNCSFSGFNLNARSGDNGSQADYLNGSFGAPGQGGSGGGQCGATTAGGPGMVANGGAGTRVDGGAIANGYWYGRGGNAGGTGENGSGGGGGGGAGGCDNGTDSYGGGGGGGGAGGCAARGGGGGGGGGGGAFGVFATGNSTVTIAGCALQRGNGGKGGDGGSGGRGQSPGQGNLGGAAPNGSPPGSGGNGAHGGHGGGGAGGQGGRSVGLGWTPGSTINNDCTFNGGAAGAAGPGGVHAPAAPGNERDGNDGQAGSAGTLESTRACATGADC